VISPFYQVGLVSGVTDLVHGVATRIDQNGVPGCLFLSLSLYLFINFFNILKPGLVHRQAPILNGSPARSGIIKKSSKSRFETSSTGDERLGVTRPTFKTNQVLLSQNPPTGHPSTYQSPEALSKVHGAPTIPGYTAAESLFETNGFFFSSIIS
jgi:hypothetical protein